MKEEHNFINWYDLKSNLCFSLKKLVSNYSLDILCVLEFATNKNAPKLSAGVPLTYYHNSDATQSVEKLTTNFLETSFSMSQKGGYMKSGFSPYTTLSEIFANKYTNMTEDKSQVRSMKAEDIYFVTNLPEMQSGYTMNLSDKKYDMLFVNGASYFIATSNRSNLWIVGKGGYVSSLADENRSQTCCFFI